MKKRTLLTLILLLTLSQAVYAATADEHYQTGNSKMAAKDYQGAIAGYTKAIELNPKSAEYYYQRAIAKSWADDMQGSLEDLSKAISIDPNGHRYFYSRSVIKSGMEDDKGAIADLKQALSLHIDPKYIARLNETIDRVEQEEHPEAYKHFLSGFKKSTNGDYRGAIADYDKAIALSPSYGDYYNSRSSAKGQLGDHQGSLDDAKQAARCNNYESRYYYAVGSAMTWFNDNGENMSNIVALYSVAVQYNADSANAERYAKALKDAEELYENMKKENAKAKDCLEFYVEDGYYGGLMLHNMCNKKVTVELSSKYSSSFYVFLKPEESQRIGPANGGTEDKILRAWMYGGMVPF